MTTFKCLKCGYEWESRKESPRSCPRCKRYDYLGKGSEYSFIVEEKAKEEQEGEEK